jgi:hypothetical protein
VCGFDIFIGKRKKKVGWMSGGGDVREVRCRGM